MIESDVLELRLNTPQAPPRPVVRVDPGDRVVEGADDLAVREVRGDSLARLLGVEIGRRNFAADPARRAVAKVRCVPSDTEPVVPDEELGLLVGRQPDVQCARLPARKTGPERKPQESKSSAATSSLKSSGEHWSPAPSIRPARSNP